MPQITDAELGKLQDRILGSATSFALNQVNADVQVELLGQVSCISGIMNTLSASITTTNTNFATALKDIQAQLTALSLKVAGDEDATKTKFGEFASGIHDACSTISSQLGRLAHHGTPENPLHVRQDGAPLRMIVELQAETLELLVRNLLEFRSEMSGHIGTMVGILAERRLNDPNLLAITAAHEERIITIEQRIAGLPAAVKLHEPPAQTPAGVRSHPTPQRK
jgi:hypothetical protein